MFRGTSFGTPRCSTLYTESRKYKPSVRYFNLVCNKKKKKINRFAKYAIVNNSGEEAKANSNILQGVESKKSIVEQRTDICAAANVELLETDYSLSLITNRSIMHERRRVLMV